MAQFAPVELLEQNVGSATGGEPWRMPPNTWRELENFFMRRNTLVCRGGQTLLGSLRPIWTQTFAATAGLTVIAGVLNKLPVAPAGVAPSTYKITWDCGGGQIPEDDGAGVITLAAVPIGTINYGTGAFTFTLPVVAASNAVATWEQIAGLPCVGAYSFYLRSGTEYLVVMDTKRLYTWDTTQERFIDRTLADTFTGDSVQFFHMVPFHDRLLVSNGKDPVYQYQPLVPSLTELPTDFDSGVAGNDIDWAKIILRHKDALHFLYTSENGDVSAQRARRTRFGDPTSYLNANTYTSMPSTTNARIVSAIQAGDSVVVFTDRYEAWRYRFQQDPKAPYIWEEIEPAYGSSTPFGTVHIPGGALTIDQGGLIVTDGQRVERLNQDLHDGLPMRMNPAQLIRCWGAKFPFRNESWITFAELGQADSSAILVYWYPAAALSMLKYPHPPRVLATFRGDVSSPTWHDVGDIYGTWDEVVISPDSTVASNADVQIVGGTIDGEVYSLINGLDDEGEVITARAKSQLLSFFPGAEAILGWVDITMSKATKVTIRFYRDFVDAYYLEHVITEAEFETDNVGTVSSRVHVNQIANYHAVEILVEDTPGFVFHAVTAYVAPVGLKRQTPKVTAVAPA